MEVELEGPREIGCLKGEQYETHWEEPALAGADQVGMLQATD